MGAIQSVDPNATIISGIQHLSQNFPDRELFVFYDGQIRKAFTSKQLFELAGKFAHRIRHQYGFKRYDVIANTLPNCPERLITDLGISLSGCIPMNGQILLADGDDFFQSARISRCSGVILSPDGNSPAWRLIKPCITGDSSSDITYLSCDRAPEMTSAILVSRLDERGRKPLLEDLKTSEEDIFVVQDVVPDDIQVVFTTSGSTGYSKLVPRTYIQMNEIWCGATREAQKSHGVTSDGGLYNDRPLGWIGGYPHATYLNGDKRVLLDSFYLGGMRSGADMWRAICNEKCESAGIMPLDLDNVIRHVTSTGGTDYKLKMLVMGGQPLKQSQIKHTFTIADGIYVGYGSTEGGLMVQGSITDPDTQIGDFFCGKPPSSVTLKILDDKGDACKTGEVGTIFVKGPGVFQGFFNRLENPDPKTAQAFTQDGFLNTEDNGYFDQGGNVYVIGRNKDTIIYGAVVLYPGWLEAKIEAHPKVAEACIVPVSDPVLYHNICACVKPLQGSQLTEKELREYCESIFVADSRAEATPVPKFYLILKDFPQTASGKPDKQTLRKIAEEKFGLKESSK